jgi:hypothetical protein
MSDDPSNAKAELNHPAATGRTAAAVAGLAAIVVGLLAASFVVAIVRGWLPTDLTGDLPNGNTKSLYQEAAHSALLDHYHIANAVAQCRGWGAVAEWPEGLPRVDDLRHLVAAKAGPPTADSSRKWETLTSLERVTLFQSDRLAADRQRFEEGARLKHDRARQNQIRILLLSAAASFLIGLKTLVSDNNASVPFPALMRGAWLPISVAALLVPVIATVYSGVLAFDDDSKNALRDARAVAQLEQLHGRIAVDVTSDPYFCPLSRLMQTAIATPAADGGPPADVKPVSAAFGPCLLDRLARVTAWGQRYEQIMNDARQSLAQAGDLPRPADGHHPAAAAASASAGGIHAKAAKSEPQGDVCARAFDPSGETQ